MDMHMWVSILNALLAFTVGALMARDTDSPVWTLCLVYFIVSTLVHVVGLYIFGIKP